MDTSSDMSSFEGENDINDGFEEDVLEPYQNEPCFETKEALENFMKSCSKNKVNLSADSEDENVDTENWKGLFSFPCLSQILSTTPEKLATWENW